MKQKQHSTGAIIRIFRQADHGETVKSICRQHNIAKATFHRWKRKYGDMDLADAKRLYVGLHRSTYRYRAKFIPPQQVQPRYTEGQIVKT